MENIYTNEYLETLLPKWNSAMQEPDAFTQLPLQRDFYARIVKNAKERTVVIISDAMRYEVGKELFHRMQDDPKCSAKLEVQLSVLPSYTRLGMAALLPHTELTMTDDFKVLVDGLPCDNLSERETILQKYNADAVCVQFDSIKSLKVAELRSVFTGKQVVYVYHNQIDARGDKPNTEDEVFVACSEAASEIIDLIRRISTSANTYRFIVTADHGFIYKRDKVAESDKIDGIKSKTAFVNRRFVVASEPVSGDGVALSLIHILLHHRRGHPATSKAGRNPPPEGKGQRLLYGLQIHIGRGGLHMVQPPHCHPLHGGQRLSTLPHPRSLLGERQGGA